MTNENDVRLVEELARRMSGEGNVETFAIDYSVLQNEEEVARMEYTHWKYYFMWLPMMLVAVYMALKVGAYRFIFVPIHDLITKQKTSKERLLLGPKKGTIFFDVFDSIGNLLRNGVTTSIALDVAYNLRILRPRIRSVGAFLTDFWINQPDGHGLRNRIKIVYRKLLEEIETRSPDNFTEVKLLALAAGSAQANIEAIYRIKNLNPEVQVSATLVDLNERSLLMAQRLAENRGVQGQVNIRLENIKTYLANQSDNSWDIVEMVGFLDYRNDRSVIEICKEIRRVLKPGGVFITSSIAPSIWAFPVRWVVNWPLLIRRTKLEFFSLLKSSWEVKDKYEIRYVPTKTHVVAFLFKVV